MEEIYPYVTAQDKRCVEVPAPPCGLVVFGASGDLAHRKLLVSLYELFRRGLLSERFYVLGVGRKELTEKQFREGVREAIEAKLSGSLGEEVKAFVDRLYYLSGDYDDALFYEKISKRVGELDKKHKVEGAVVFYLAVPPFLYGSIVENLGRSGLSCGEGADSRQRVRLVVEKPFGRDLQSAEELNRVVHKCFDESQVYRIDHYLGKETVQNILMFRFANAIFEPVWNRNYIDSIQITIAETVGVEHRAGYYDKSGALRDMFQNHMLQMLAFSGVVSECCQGPVRARRDSRGKGCGVS
jgi:glucose-6-phosphate 1-dehydrogenase